MMNGSNIEKIEIGIYYGKISAHVSYVSGGAIDLIGEDSVNSAINQLVSERGLNVIAMLLSNTSPKPIVIKDEKVMNKYDFDGTKFIDKTKSSKQRKTNSKVDNKPVLNPEPEKPAEVVKPEKPVETAKPEKPTEAVKPEKPAETAKPEKPAETVKPEKPAEAAKPEKPAETVKPETHTKQNIGVRNLPRINNLKVNGKKIAAVCLAGLVLVGSWYTLSSLNRNNSNRNNNVSNNDSNVRNENVVYEQNNPYNYDYNYNYDYEENNFNQNMYAFQDVESRVNEINENCYRNISDIYSFLYNGNGLNESINLCDVQNYVNSDDRAAVDAITIARNNIVNEAYNYKSEPITLTSVYVFMADYVNYVFENGTTFNGVPIKSYESLDPYSQYAVAILGQSILQLRPDYDYTSRSSNRNYQYDNLMSAFESITNSTRSSLDGRHY